MNDKDKSLSPVRQSYREAGRAICNRYAVLKAMAPAQKVAPAAGHRDEANFGAKSVPSVAPAAGQSDGQERETDQSYAQVESLVLPPHSGALKRDSIAVGVTIGVTISDENRITGQK